jgi:hypothetical protein
MCSFGIFCAHLVYVVPIWYILSSFGIFCAHLVYVVPIWYTLCPFGILCAHLVYFVPIWHIFPVLVFCSKKTQTLVPRSAISSWSHVHIVIDICENVHTREIVHRHFKCAACKRWMHCLKQSIGCKFCQNFCPNFCPNFRPNFVRISSEFCTKRLTRRKARF